MASAPPSSKSQVQRGRPKGTKTFDAPTAIAFGAVIRRRRLALGIAQEQLALLSSTDRSFVGKVERGENQPSLVLILRLANALGCSGADLVADVETNLARLSKRIG
jgi:XRE family transcriptional regulator, regulator of sulfur utilization